MDAGREDSVSDMGYLSEAELAQLKLTHPEISDQCPTCLGATVYTWKGTERFCDCREQRRLNVQYSRAGIGMTYQRLDWSDLRPLFPPDKERIDRYLASPDRYVTQGIGLMLSGGVGTGKTLLVNLILKALIRQGYDCYFTTFSGAIEAFTSTWGDNAEKRRFADRFMRSRVLCLDDLGKEFRAKTNNLAESTFDNILRTRVQEARPTLLTTNLAAVDLTIGYGASALSLLLEKCIGITMAGEDFRPKAHDRIIDEVERGETRPIV